MPSVDFLEEVRGRHRRHIVFFPILRMGTDQSAAKDPKDYYRVQYMM